MKVQISPRSVAALGIFDELKKVTWPSKQETARFTFIVIFICLIIGLYIGIIDIFLAKALQAIAAK